MHIFLALSLCVCVYENMRSTNNQTGRKQSTQRKSEANVVSTGLDPVFGQMPKFKQQRSHTVHSTSRTNILFLIELQTRKDEETTRNEKKRRKIQIIAMPSAVAYLPSPSPFHNSYENHRTKKEYRQFTDPHKASLCLLHSNLLCIGWANACVRVYASERGCSKRVRTE